MTLNSSLLTYNGTSQTLFTIKCVDDNGCEFKYSVSTESSPTTTISDWENGPSTNGSIVNASATKAGTYYLHLFRNGSYNTYSWGDNGSNVKGVTISEASANNINATINNPNPTGLDASSNPYYVIGEGAGDITLPFTADVSSSIETGTSFSSNTTKTWSIDNSADSNISIGSSDGKLTINSGLGEGVYTVKLTLKVTNKNYETKTVDKTIKIIKTADYDIKFKDGEGLDDLTNNG